MKTQKVSIISVERRGWAGDTFYQVQNGKGKPIEVDAYKIGSALLQPGEIVRLPKPTTNTSLRQPPF